jgi:hypothetical protein
MQNLGPKLQFDGPGLQVDEGDAASQTATESFELPAAVSFSATMDLLSSDSSVLMLSVAEDLPNLSEESFNIGAEYALFDTYYLRGGYQGVGLDSSYERGGLTLGGGLFRDLSESLGIAVDYAYADLGLLDTTHRYSVALFF